MIYGLGLLNVSPLGIRLRPGTLLVLKHHCDLQALCRFFVFLQILYFFKMSLQDLLKDTQFLKNHTIVINFSGDRRPVVRDYLLEAFESVHISRTSFIGLGSVQTGNVWHAVVKNDTIRDRILALSSMAYRNGTARFSSLVQSVVKVRVHWLPLHVPHDVVCRFFDAWGTVREASFEMSVSSGTYDMATMVRSYVLELHDGITKEDLPFVSCFLYDGEELYLLCTMTGRKPRCLKCRQVGHYKPECKNHFCKHCGSYQLHTTLECPHKNTLAGRLRARQAQEPAEMQVDDPRHGGPAPGPAPVSVGQASGTPAASKAAPVSAGVAPLVSVSTPSTSVSSPSTSVSTPSTSVSTPSTSVPSSSSVSPVSSVGVVPQSTSSPSFSSSSSSSSSSSGSSSVSSPSSTAVSMSVETTVTGASSTRVSACVDEASASQVSDSELMDICISSELSFMDSFPVLFLSGQSSPQTDPPPVTIAAVVKSSRSETSSPAPESSQDSPFVKLPRPLGKRMSLKERAAV